MKPTLRHVLACFEKEKDLPSPVIYETTDSTNLRARVLAEQGAQHGTAVIAFSQSAGRGRFTRRFVSDEGGLYMSVILRDIPIEAATRLTPYAAVCAARVLELLCADIKIDVKWVNDLYLRGRKLAGILTESSLAADGKTLEYAVVGIGINLTNRLEGELAEMAISLVEVATAPDIGDLAQRMTVELSKAVTAIKDGDFMREYRERCFMLGHRVTVHAEEAYVATAITVEEDASLTVLLDSGETRSLSSGEVSVRF